MSNDNGGIPPQSPQPPAYPGAPVPPQQPVSPAAAPAPQAPVPPAPAYPGAAPQQPVSPAYPVSAPPQPAAPVYPGSLPPQPAAPTYPGAAPAAPGYPAPSYAQPYAQPYGQPYAAPLKSNGLAITAMICGIAGVVLFWIAYIVAPFLASVAAIITGHMALGRIKRDATLGGKGLAITGVVLGYLGAVLNLIIGVGFLLLIIYGISQGSSSSY